MQQVLCSVSIELSSASKRLAVRVLAAMTAGLHG